MIRRIEAIEKGKRFDEQHDENGNIIFYVKEDGKKVWLKYADDNDIYYKTNTGVSYRYHFDNNDNIVYRVSDSCEEWYDKFGNITYHYDFTIDYKEWREYDADGNLIYLKDCSGLEIWYRDGRVILRKESNGTKKWYGYDQNGKLIRTKDSAGYEEWYGYDQNGSDQD